MTYRKVALFVSAVVVLGVCLGSVAGPVPHVSSSRVFHFSYLTSAVDGPPKESQEFFRDLYFNICKANPEFASRFSEYDIRPVRPGDGVSEFSIQETLSILTPLKFVEYRESLGSKLVPIMVAAKGGPVDTYYSAAFVVSNASIIESLDSPDIKAIYLLGPNSLSGHIAPLAELHDQQLIPSASLEGLKRRGWRIEVCDSHATVVEKVAGDSNAVGCTWSNPGVHAVRTILRYGSFTQDIIGCSGDLKEFEPVLISAFQKTLRDREAPAGTDGGAAASAHGAPFLEIVGVHKFKPENENSLHRIRAMWLSVRTTKITGVGMLVFALAVTIVCLAVRVVRTSDIWNTRVGWKRGTAILILVLQTAADSAVASILIIIPVLVVPALSSQRELLVNTPNDRIAFVVVVGVAMLLGLMISSFPVAEILVRDGRKILVLNASRFAGVKFPGSETDKEEPSPTVASSSSAPARTEPVRVPTMCHNGSRGVVEAGRDPFRPSATAGRDAARSRSDEHGNQMTVGLPGAAIPNPPNGSSPAPLPGQISIVTALLDQSTVNGGHDRPIG